ncbi:MAG: precorrin-3B C(17)-methyltransferase [Defluviicoccus sp.]|nr:precorrin-3B C(17)-methyltransferase [Defluviicoccus sp.]MDE0383180.1 precorrin-3B C(17)-methyltransferase [Defluviicoccus sp.]
MSGRVCVVGLGPGDARHLTPAAADALGEARHLVGYGPYLARVAARKDQVVHPSDNREELHRARHALALAAQGETVALVSSGDAGVFAMAATLFEALEDAGGADVEIEVIPGVTAMTAAAARIGAPLGHDFCALSLSDNLKPWETVLARLRAAAEADFVIALYNPASRARPWQLGEALELLRGVRAGDTPVVFATAVSRPEEEIVVVKLAEARAEMADMRTLVIVGSSATRSLPRAGGGAWVYTPRKAAVPA